jgi:tungstate transport system ATP-binding protein
MFCECENLQVRYGRACVLDVDHLALPAGRITAFVGPNGAGKTTLLEVIALLRRPSGGRVRLWGQTATAGDRRLQRRVVMVMHPGYLFRGSVWHNVLYGLRARGVRGEAARSRARRALEDVGLAGFARRDAAGLSAGERQRLNLARALAVEPEAILLDEPTANVDAHTVEVIRQLLRRLRDERRTTVVHACPVGQRLMDVTDHVVRLAGGRVQTDPQPQTPHRAADVPEPARC